ncbi:S-layer homology domain-containing protein [Paenibacillus sp. CF384]|uniref:S-layer homology domain-containing protein n=1 Tax=Paenibacillus sp. CF384 TaxID=1884382 RepID=UPI0008965087|nr:S-layer homology domain-containing protein [Paenibacillus sp. CF384]SDX62115.1 Carbohydrate binding domain-containing protein [Paenibacillus sp. CF384]
MKKRIGAFAMAMMMLAPMNTFAADAVAASSEGVVYGTNLVPNGDFESGAIDWPNWVNINIGKEAPHGKEQALKIPAGFGITGLDFGALEPNRTYRFGAWYKFVNGDAGGNLKLTLGKSFSKQLDFTENDGEYHYIETIFTAPPELMPTSNSNLTLVKWSGADFYLDDVVLEKVSSAEDVKKEAIAPSFLHAADNSETAVDLVWEKPQGNPAVKYTVYQDDKAVGDTANTSFTVKGLEAGGVYNFKVVAAKESQTSFATNTLNVHTVTPLPALTKELYPGQIGVGLEGIGGRGYEFADAAKTLRQWVKADGSEGVKVDANGWPKEDAATVFFDHRPVAAWLNDIDDPTKQFPDISGVYKLSFKGQAVLGNMDASSPFKVENQKYDKKSNTTTADIVLAKGNGLLYMTFTKTSGGVSDVKLMRPGYSAGDTFTKEFLQALQPFGTLRFMDWLSTNNNNPAYPAVTEWSDRKLTTDATQLLQDGTHGVAWEYVIALANQTGKDIWINIPVAASNDYVKSLAALLKAKLNPGIKIYLEYSNEVWNDLFTQQAYNKAAALAEGAKEGSALSQYTMQSYFDDPNDGDYTPQKRSWTRHRIAQRLIEIGQQFQTVFGEDSLNTRVRPVLSWFAIIPDQYEDMLNWVSKSYGDPKNYFYAIASAPYFNSSAASDAASTTEVLTAMQEDSKRFSGPDETKQELITLADQYGLKSYTYEGGPDSGGGSTINVENRIAAHRSERMGDLVRYDVGNNFLDKNGDMFMYFTLTSGYNRYGMWGASEDILDNLDTPKYKALTSLLGTDVQPFSDVAKSHFAYEAVKSLYAAHIVTGENGSFLPKRVLTGGELQTMLNRIGAYVQSRSVAALADYTAANLGDGAVTREKLAVLLVQAYEAGTGRKVKHPEAVVLKDAKQVKADALTSVEAAVATGLLSADGGKFKPQAKVTRAEAAVALARLLEYVR